MQGGKAVAHLAHAGVADLEARGVAKDLSAHALGDCHPEDVSSRGNGRRNQDPFRRGAEHRGQSGDNHPARIRGFEYHLA